MVKGLPINFFTPDKKVLLQGWVESSEYSVSHSLTALARKRFAAATFHFGER